MSLQKSGKEKKPAEGPRDDSRARRPWYRGVALGLGRGVAPRSEGSRALIALPFQGPDKSWEGKNRDSTRLGGGAKKVLCAGAHKRGLSTSYYLGECGVTVN